MASSLIVALLTAFCFSARAVASLDPSFDVPVQHPPGFAAPERPEGSPTGPIDWSKHQHAKNSWLPKNVSQTITALVNNYDNRLRPKFGTDVLKIGMELVIASFDSISEVNMDYTITMYLNQYWRDERLAFMVDHPERMMTLTAEFSSKIWVPDTFFANDKHSFLHDVTEQNKMIRLSGDGSIVYGMRFTTTLACMMDLRYYPLDEQNCTVEIESYGYPLEDVMMYWKEGKKSIHNVDKIEMPQFSLLEYNAIAHVIALSTGKYQRLSLSFRLRRNVGFFVFQTYLPSILIVMLSWVSFWINHEATSARVALGITTVLTMTTISTGVRASLPRISYVKAIDIYLVMCFVFVFAALLEYAAVNYTYWGARSKRKAKRLAMREEMLAQAKPKGAQSSSTDPKSIRMSPIMSIRHGALSSSTFVNNHLASQDSDSAPPSPNLDSPPEASGNGKSVRGGADPSQEASADPESCPVIRMTPVLPRAATCHLRKPHSGLRHRGGPAHLLAGTAASLAGPAAHLGLGCSGMGPGATRRARMAANFRAKAREIKQRLPRVRDVNKIDKFSRLVFPSLFICFNIGYWCFYLL